MRFCTSNTAYFPFYKVPIVQSNASQFNGLLVINTFMGAYLLFSSCFIALINENDLFTRYLLNVPRTAD